MPIKVSMKVQRIAGTLFSQVENIMFPCISWERSFLPRFPSREKILCFEEKIPPFQIVQERSSPSTVLFEKSIFSEHLKKISYFRVFFFFFRKVIFHFPSEGKTKFSGKRNIIFPNNTRKIKFQRDFLWKDYLFRTPGKRKYGFPCSVNRPPFLYFAI